MYDVHIAVVSSASDPMELVVNGRSYGPLSTNKRLFAAWNKVEDLRQARRDLDTRIRRAEAELVAIGPVD
jgi:hypothetical protein